MFTEEQKAILIKTAEYMVKRENTSEYSENIRKIAEVALSVLNAEPVAFYANGAYYNTARAAFKDGAEEVTPLYTR